MFCLHYRRTANNDGREIIDFQYNLEKVLYQFSKISILTNNADVMGNERFFCLSVKQIEKALIITKNSSKNLKEELTNEMPYQPVI